MRSLIVASALLLSAPLGAQPPGIAVAPGDGVRVRSIRAYQPMALTQSLVQSPRMVSRADRTIVAWLEPDDSGRDRLYTVSLRDERQQDYPIERLAQAVDSEVGTHSTAPVVALNEAGRQAAWAWLTTDGDRQLLMVRREGSMPQVVANTDGLLEFPTIAFDSADRLYAAWTHQVGGRSEVRVAWDDEGGLWRQSGVAEAAQTYDLLPHLFGGANDARLLWYSIDGSEIDLLASRLDPVANTLTVRSTLVDIPAYRLPLLFKAGSPEVLGALWLEPVDGGEVYMALDARLPGFPSPALVGEIDHPPALATVSSEGHGALAWISRAGGQATLIVNNPHGEALRQQVAPTVADPQVSISRGWTNLVWTESEAASGLSTLWFMRAR